MTAKLLLNRPMTTDGLPTGSNNLNGVGSIETPIDYFIEAQPGERLAIARVLIHIVDSGTFDSGSYGNGIVLTNGIQVFYKRGSITVDVTDGLPIKTNVDWGRWCFDMRKSDFGQGNECLIAKWSLSAYGGRFGIILDPGDRVGVRIRDDLSDLVEQTIIAEGVHHGIPSPAWITQL